VTRARENEEVQRQKLLDLLEDYAVAHRDERSCVDAIRGLVESHSDCFERSCLPGHITASAWIVSADYQRFLLTHHRKLGRWLQLGGHADGDPDVEAVALREAQEESGMEHFECLPATAKCRVFDLDVHVIPARPGEPEHEHHDVRFLLVAAQDQPLQLSDESNDLRWFDWSESDKVASDESVARLARKARARLGLGN